MDPRIKEDRIMNKRMKNILFIGIGGIIGSLGRYFISIILPIESNLFSVPILIVNYVGCFLLTWIIFQQKFRQRMKIETQEAITVGAIGSFTTFSTWIFEITEVLPGEFGYIIFYTLLYLSGGVLFSFLGFYVASKQ